MKGGKKMDMSLSEKGAQGGREKGGYVKATWEMTRGRKKQKIRG